MQARGYPNATLVKMSGELDQRMLLFQTQAVAQAEFKNLMQSDKEGLRELSGCVKSLGDVANANVGTHHRDDMNREQFID